MLRVIVHNVIVHVTAEYNMFNKISISVVAGSSMYLYDSLSIEKLQCTALSIALCFCIVNVYFICSKYFNGNVEINIGWFANSVCLLVMCINVYELVWLFIVLILLPLCT